MNIFDIFCSKFPLESNTQIQIAIAFIWFHIRSTGEKSCTIKEICDYFEQALLPRPNVTRLANGLGVSQLVFKCAQNGYQINRFVMEKFNKDYGNIFENQVEEPTIIETTTLDNAPYLTSTDIEAAKRMAQAYVVLHCYENSVRALINSVLTKHLGDDWWNLASSSPMKTKLRDRKEKELKNSWLAPRGDCPLYYMDWGDLLSLIRKYETEFSSTIKNYKFAELRLEELEQVRNIVAHNGVFPSEDDFQRIRLSFNDWCRQVGKNC